MFAQDAQSDFVDAAVGIEVKGSIWLKIETSGTARRDQAVQQAPQPETPLKGIYNKFH